MDGLQKLFNFLT